MTLTLLCSICRKNTVTDCDGQRRVDRDGRIMCFDCRTHQLLRDMPVLQTSASEPLAMAFSCAGDRELERALHAFLSPHAVSGEWFRYGPYIHDLIDEMCDFLSEKAGDADEFGVPITASELRRIVTSPTYGKTDAEIHAVACGNRGEC
ncbi:hypothetical protein CHY08_34210 (plasmid) [Rhizobium leguminosarum bv. viciae]|uniref:hypothetical protein n=1 Tax=Rhizobium leguminosarum TaxID=384 RepID=UPI000B8CA6A9|nr:hypothetical protein [Rhizobium leguminosarum]ASR12111.1 hypothetical protein CHY08_34210 [Rhizobium leguminosarum bv. viciae]